MTNKKFLALLMTASMAFQQTVRAEDVVTPKTETPAVVDAAHEVLDAAKETASDAASTVATAVENAATAVADAASTVATDIKNTASDASAEATEEVESDKPTLPAAQIALLRTVYFLVTKNIVRYFSLKSYKVEKFKLDNYVNHGFSYGADVALPYKNKEDVTTLMKIAEYLGNEVTVVDDAGKFDFLASKNKDWAGKTFFKALNRKQLFLPKGSDMHAFLTSPQAYFVTAGLEGWDGKTTRKTMAKDFVTAHMFGAIAQFANKMAKDIIAALVLSGKMPEALDKFMDSAANMNLIENVLAQVIEDMIQTTEAHTTNLLP